MTLLQPRALREESGQAVVELALVALVLMTLVFGGLEIGRLVNAWAVVTQASREGARVGAARCTLEPTCGDLVAARVDGSLAGLDVSGVTWSMDPGPYVPGDGFTVLVAFRVVPVTPLIGALFPAGGILVRSETTMRLE